MHFRHPLLALLCAVSLILAFQNALRGQAPELPETPQIVDRHAWDQFGVGSWKLVRVYQETIKENGEIESASITETRTTLERVDDKGYSLKVEVTVEVAGKRFTAEPKLIAYGYQGGLQGQKVEVTQLGKSDVEICGRKFETDKRQIVINGDSTQSISTVEYFASAAPFFLKRTTTSIDPMTKVPNYNSNVEVIAVDMPEKVLTEIKSVAHVRTVESFGEEGSNGSKVTLEVHCNAVPGGVVSHTSWQLKRQPKPKEDRVVRSMLELVDYEAVLKPPVINQPTTKMSRRRAFKSRRRK